MKLVITDLDNTLYDWVTYFAMSFSAMVDELVSILDLDRDVILDQFKHVHHVNKNSEQPFDVLELPAVKKKFTGEDNLSVLRHLDPALQAFNKMRERHLRLYPGVRSTLRRLRNAGVCVTAHTEAIAVNAYFRLRRLGIWKYINHLYALEGKLLPHPVPEREKVHSPPKRYVDLLPTSKRKPNPELLLDICHHQGFDPSEAVYIGDSLTRDISMAKEAGVFAIWAQYGTTYDRSLWLLLTRVTHWTDEDVANEDRLKELYQHIEPDLTIGAFSDILSLLSDDPDTGGRMHKSAKSSIERIKDS